ncbi:hypothetical protein ZYGM_001633 [Zygosaccharomyces mellis]|uniref:Uncharacterized protein n=1 Tax=Zygosaccharomyces mellis TaxID=42258 RepID=A0A4C2EAG9_9SACH|nr:hypothetical protein ZYGM_001633 [Zygosaccharomyces mellis]
MNSVSNSSGLVSESVAGSMESGSQPVNDGSLAIRANQLPKALAEDQNKFIHLDPVPDFKDKAEIKPWLQKIFYPQGIEIVIERSDNIKVIFKCKASKRGKNTKPRRSEVTTTNSMSANFSNAASPSTGLGSIVGKKKRSVSRFNTCPFRIRATFSLKRKKWNIVVVNNSHSHELRFDPDSDEYRKFKEKLREDNDWDAVKQFDELEYKSRSNLPIESSLIPCECGLTSEIESFSIVLPSTKPAQYNGGTGNNSNDDVNNYRDSVVNSCSGIAGSTSGIAPVISKPRSKKWYQQQQQRHREKLMKNPSTEHLFAQSRLHSQLQQLQQGCPIEFLDPSIFAGAFPSSPASSSITTQPLQQHPLQLTDPLTEFDEVDFTDIFKPHSIHLQDVHPNTQQGQETDILEPSQPSPSQFLDTNHESAKRDEFPSLLFSPLDAATNELMTPAGDISVSSSQPSTSQNNTSNHEWSTGVTPHEQSHQHQQQQQQPALRQYFNDDGILAPERLTTLWSQQQETSSSPLRRVVNAADSQSPFTENDYAVDDLLWKMNFENA